MSAEPGLKTSHIVKATGLGREALRFYERKGLLPKPARTTAGYRQFPPETIQRIRFIKQAQSAGFSLREIQQMLRLKVGPATTCGSMEKITRKKIGDIQQKIRSLQAMKRTLTLFAHACEKGRTHQCNVIIEGLTGRKCKETRS